MPKSSAHTLPVTAIVTAYKQIAKTIDTLRRILECSPAPAEVLVHVDGNQARCAEAIQAGFPTVRVILSEENIGPGGGRNKLISMASHELVASFDDDSYPIDKDYFFRVRTVFDAVPDASIVTGLVFHQDEKILPDVKTMEWVADFSGGGCAYRRSDFMKTSGYVPLPTAYGMEEVDLALRLHAQGERILRTPWLRVFHDTDCSHHATARVTSASLSNLGLLVYLRYPTKLWPLGAGQVANRMRWLLAHRRVSGLLLGLVRIPLACWRFRSYRHPLSGTVVRSYINLRRNPVPVHEQHVQRARS